MWNKVKDFIKKNWLALTAIVISIYSFIFHRNRRQGLDCGKQLCTDVGERIADAEDGLDKAAEQLAVSQSQTESVISGIDKISREAITAGDIVRKYQSGDDKTI